MSRLAACCLTLWTLAALTFPAPARADDALLEEVRRISGDGVVVVVDEEGKELVALNEEREFIPASTLKVVTAMAALEILGPDYHFETRFYVDDQDRLLVEGRGDPFLVSEELDLLAPALLATGRTEFSGMVLDDSYFEHGITIPGVSTTDKPYDALNSALAVNFNTIFVTINGSTITSAEEQTPLVPLAIEAARASGRSGKVRINLSDDPERALRYAGELIRAKLIEHGATVGETIEVGRVPDGLEPLYVHANSRPLSEVIASMLYYSNNYTANQIMLEMGVASAGPPATVDKGVAAGRGVLDKLGLADEITYVEGSGISRDNRATAGAMLRLLSLFEPYKELLRDRRGALAKTGSLSVTKTIVGYLDTPQHGEVRFVFALGGGYWEQRFTLIDLLKERL